MGSTAYSYEAMSRLAFPRLDLLGLFEDASAATIFTYKLPHFLNIYFNIRRKSHDIILHNDHLQMSLQVIPRNSCKAPWSASETIVIYWKNP